MSTTAPAATSIGAASTDIPGWTTSIADPARLGAVRRTGLSRGADPALDRLAAICAAVVDAPCAVIALVGDDRMHLAGGHGLPDQLELQREWPIDPRSLAVRVVHERCGRAVNDTRVEVGEPSDGRLSAVAAVVATPVFDVDGYAIGAVCALDTVPRQWDACVLDRLAPITQLVSRELRFASTMPADSRNYRLGATPPTRTQWRPGFAPAAA